MCHKSKPNQIQTRLYLFYKCLQSIRKAWLHVFRSTKCTYASQTFIPAVSAESQYRWWVGERKLVKRHGWSIKRAVSYKSVDQMGQRKESGRTRNKKRKPMSMRALLGRTGSILGRGVRPHPKKGCFGYDGKLNLMARFQFWRSWDLTSMSTLILLGYHLWVKYVCLKSFVFDRNSWCHITVNYLY